jgi:hypothetical protein
VRVKVAPAVGFEPTTKRLTAARFPSLSEHECGIIGQCGKSPGKSPDPRWSAWGSDHQLQITFPRKGAGYVYVAWGADHERPLYVGKAVTPSERILWHVRNAKWAAEVEDWEVYGFPTVELAEAVEIEAIYELNPVHNVLRVTRRTQWLETWVGAVSGRGAARQ